MGTAASHSSEEEEEGAAEEGMEGAVADAQPGALFPPGAAASPAPPLPPADVLLEQARLREATARLREAALPESLVSRHHSTLVRWLEERLSRGDEAVSLEQFCEVLESVSRLAAGSRGESEEVRRRRRGRGPARAAGGEPAAGAPRGKTRLPGPGAASGGRSSGEGAAAAGGGSPRAAGCPRARGVAAPHGRGEPGQPFLVPSEAGAEGSAAADPQRSASRHLCSAVVPIYL